MPTLPQHREVDEEGEHEGGSDVRGTVVQVPNPHVADMEEDILYHLGLGTATHDLHAMFGDVRVRGKIIFSHLISNCLAKSIDPIIIMHICR
jgi:hypothetical protein